jgi:hypothetical protein
VPRTDGSLYIDTSQSRSLHIGERRHLHNNIFKLVTCCLRDAYMLLSEYERASSHRLITLKSQLGVLQVLGKVGASCFPSPAPAIAGQLDDGKECEVHECMTNPHVVLPGLLGSLCFFLLLDGNILATI